AKKDGFTLPDALSPEQLDSETGVALALEVAKANTEIHYNLIHEKPALVAEQLQNLAGFIHEFFENTMIMADDEQTRNHRLKLAQETVDTILLVGDFSRIVLEGEKKN